GTSDDGGWRLIFEFRDGQAQITREATAVGK
ncbi:MAG: hypothetical protein H6Q33_5198, partial [Deltaproteobacteria bacterium]|nr:hypothetical protein [Deltaproteobacteria bacterium]